MLSQQKARLLARSLFACALIGLSISAWAQGVQCGPRERVLGALSENYQERLVSRGVTSAGALLEVLAGPSGSWSILLTVPGGQTCLVSSGEGWRQLPPRSSPQEPTV